MKKEQFFFVGLTFLLSWPIFILAKSGMSFFITLYQSKAWMFSPAISAFVTLLIYKEDIGFFNLKKPSRILIVSILITSFLAFEIIASHLLNINIITQQKDYPGIYILLMSFLMNSVLVIGEEIGWRGYLFNSLNKDKVLNFFESNLLIGFIWGLWHLPLLGFDFMLTGIMIIKTISLSILFSATFVKTKNIIPAILAHGTYNFLVNQHSLIYQVSGSGFLLTEMLILIVASSGIIFLKARSERSSNDKKLRKTSH